MKNTMGLNMLPIQKECLCSCREDTKKSKKVIYLLKKLAKDKKALAPIKSLESQISKDTSITFKQRESQI